MSGRVRTFIPAHCHPDRPHTAHGLCLACYTRAWNLRHPEKRAQDAARYRQRRLDPVWLEKQRARWREHARAMRQNKPNVRKEVKRASFISRYYNCTRAQYQEALRLQLGLCAICLRALEQGDPRGTHVDHDHQTNTFRGLLCGNCNRGLGSFRDSADLLNRAIEYLARAR